MIEKHETICIFENWDVAYVNNVWLNISRGLTGLPKTIGYNPGLIYFYL
jgi:hypothetical protein